MTTQTEEARVAQVAVEGAVSVERSLGRLEGKSDILVQTVREQGRQAREDYQRLDAKIDRLLYWILGIAGVTIATIIGSALAVIIAQR